MSELDGGYLVPAVHYTLLFSCVFEIAMPVPHTAVRHGLPRGIRLDVYFTKGTMEGPWVGKQWAELRASNTKAALALHSS